MLHLECLESRDLPSLFAPVTPWHYAPSNAPADPVGDGFNLVAVSSPEQLAQVPAGDKALVGLDGTGGVTPTFLGAIAPYVGNPKVYGFYLADEPHGVPPANLKATSDWIHQNDPGAKTFIVLGPLPIFSPYTPASTDIDFVGLDPYPVRTWGVDFEYIPLAVLTAELDGWSIGQMVPVYQAFGGKGSFSSPTVTDEEISLAIWSLLTPTPAFDYAYSWADWSGESLVDRGDLQNVFSAPKTNPVVLWEQLLARY